MRAVAKAITFASETLKMEIEEEEEYNAIIDLVR